MLGSEAELALVDALQAVGLEARLAELPDSHADIEVQTPDGRKILIEAKYRTLASPDGLPRQLERYAHDLRRLEIVEGEPVVGVLVADRVTEAARAILQDAGWGWLDLRGQLHVAAPGTYIHADIQPLRGHTASTDPFGGRAGLEVSVELLLNPTDSVGVRSLASRIGRAPSTVSEVLARLRSASLVDAAQRPMIPDLFWSLASAWRSTSADASSLPSMRDRPLLEALRIRLDDEAAAGWALTDTTAAAIYGAPIGARKDHPPDFYVPDMRTLRRATQVLGPAADPSARAATLHAAPVAAACLDRVRGTSTLDNHWPLARPLFVALDLAQDPGRGREILDQWNPPEPWARVW
ncbi:transcriptional regulator [Mycolicibacterium moriokaense]|nr:transcriptional regulator [Mycolicibacterium moriokaense]